MQYTQMEQARYWPFQVYEVPVTTLPVHVNAMSVAITEGYRLTIQACCSFSLNDPSAFKHMDSFIS